MSSNCGNCNSEPTSCSGTCSTEPAPVAHTTFLVPPTGKRSKSAREAADEFVGAHNSCRLCAPLGAGLAFRGIQGCTPFLHGSQGCATYIRRYLISHFREPIDLASSNFSESSAVFGGSDIFKAGLKNLRKQYNPEVIGIATTCLSETIGENIPSLIHSYLAENWDENHPPLVHVATPSYKGCHTDGFNATVEAIVRALVKPCDKNDRVAVIPGMLSPTDLRYLRELTREFKIQGIILPDYSDSMDGASWASYHNIPDGGTTLANIRLLGGAKAAIEFGLALKTARSSASQYLEQEFGVGRMALPTPIGIENSDALLQALAELSGNPIPDELEKERGRLIDSMVDGHKYVFGKRVAIVADQDLALGLTKFMTEIGVKPVLVASGQQTGYFSGLLAEVAPELGDSVICREDADHAEVDALCKELKPDFILGSSKCYSITRDLNIPLIRVGFPIHDRMGGQRVLHLGHRGAQQLFDTIVNTLLEKRQDDSEIGFSYM